MLSIIIHTKNSATTLVDTFTSLQPLVDELSAEIIVVDMKSSDKTPQLAKKNKAVKFFEHADVGYVEPARQFAINKAKFDWIFIIDSDELTSPKLSQKIVDVVKNNLHQKEQADAYYLPRQNKIFGRYLEHTLWYPDYQLRLFKKGTVTWPKTLHAQPEIKGTAFHFPPDQGLAILHQNYQSLEEYWSRANHYTNIQAQELAEIGPTYENYEATLFLERFDSEFNRRFFSAQGYLDGNHGTLLSLFQASVETLTLAKVWQTQDFPHQAFDALELRAFFKRRQKELNYYRADTILQTDIRLNFCTRFYWRIRRKLKI